MHFTKLPQRELKGKSLVKGVSDVNGTGEDSRRDLSTSYGLHGSAGNLRGLWLSRDEGHWIAPGTESRRVGDLTNTGIFPERSSVGPSVDGEGNRGRGGVVGDVFDARTRDVSNPGTGAAALALDGLSGRAVYLLELSGDGVVFGARAAAVFTDVGLDAGIAAGDDFTEQIQVTIVVGVDGATEVSGDGRGGIVGDDEATAAHTDVVIVAARRHGGGRQSIGCPGGEAGTGW